MKHRRLITLSVLSINLFTACSDTRSANADASGSALDAQKIPLLTEIPLFIKDGTPPESKLPRTEPMPSATPSILVSGDTTLLSRGKAVTSSDDNPYIGELSYVTDGDKEGGDGYYVELMDGLQWVQIDLEEPAALEGIWIWHLHSIYHAYHDVIVQVSNDPQFKTSVKTLFNNDYDHSADFGKGSDKPYMESHFGKLIDARGIKARYVRLYSNGSTHSGNNHYAEVEVFGIPQALE